MLLSDRSIRARLANHPMIDPYPSNRQIQPASVDLRLGEFMKDLEGNGFLAYDGEMFQLEPGRVYLMHTLERVCLPADIAARVEGKSSLGRQGIMIHLTAGFIDPGFTGQITLEVVNLDREIVHLTPGEPIAQICFMQLTSAAERPYGSPDLGSKYQYQTGATSARQ